MFKKQSENKMQDGGEDKLRGKSVRAGEAGELIVASPLPHRPGVLAVRLPSGRIVLDGTDRRPLSGAERRAIFGETKSRRSVPNETAAWTDDERAELAKVEAHVEVAGAAYGAALHREEDAARKRSGGGPVLVVETELMREAHRAVDGARRAVHATRDRIRRAVYRRKLEARVGQLSETHRAILEAHGVAVPEPLNMAQAHELGERAERLMRGEVVVESAETKIRRLEDRLLALEGGRGGAA